jgi:hypothetical protein
MFNVILFSSVAPADSSARAALQAKTKKTVSGTLAVYHKDFFEQGRGEYGLAVRDASGKHTQLNVAAIGLARDRDTHGDRTLAPTGRRWTRAA